MKAPEKIYCVATEGGFYFTTIKPEPPFAKGVEYTRTDSFTAWKPAAGDSLPEIDREVIALVEEHGLCKVVFAHRPNPNGDAICFDKGGWNMPDIRYWLDLELPKMEE